MKKFSATLLTASILLPAFVAAEDFESYVNRMIQNAKDGGGTVIIENHSSVSTGGQVAGPGQTVTTDGDVSASSHTETRINAGNDGGTVYVKTETTKNGETKKEEYTKEVEPGMPVEVNVSAKANSEGSHIKANIDGEAVFEDVSSVDADADVAIMTQVETAFKAVPLFFKKVLGFFFGW